MRGRATLLLPAVVGWVPSKAVALNEIIGGHGGEIIAHTNQTIGWSFDVIEPIAIGALGWGSELRPDSTSEPHHVAIWKEDALGAHELIVERTIPARASFSPLAEVALTLQSGRYILGGLDTPAESLPNDLIAGDFSGTSFSAETYNLLPNSVVVGQALTNDSPNFSVPTTPRAGEKSILLGPQFLVIPEPSSLMLLFLGSLMMFTKRMSRRFGSLFIVFSLPSIATRTGPIGRRLIQR